EALVSTLENKGIPGMVQRTLIRPPSSRLGAITPQERQAVINQSPVAGQYDRTVDRESAFEMLQQRAQRVKQQKEEEVQQQEADTGGWTIPGFGNDEKPTRGKGRTTSRSSSRQTVTE